MEGKRIDQLAIGDCAEAMYVVTEEDCAAYAQVTMDYNPVHFDNTFAQSARFKGKIAHGMILAGYISGVIGTMLPGPGCLYETQTLSFLKPVYFGDTITVRVCVTEIKATRNRVVLRTECCNQQGEVVLTGDAVVLPRKSFTPQKEGDSAMMISDLLPRLDVPAVLVRDGSFQVLEQCTRIRQPNALTYLENAKYLFTLEDLNLSCVICLPELADCIPSHIHGIVSCDAPKLLFFKLQNLLLEQRKKLPTQIDSTAQISEQAYIAPCNVIIGRNVVIEPMAAIHENTVIEDDVRICSGTVIGGQSFTMVREGEGGFLARDAGSVRIERGVEICSNCHVARGTLELDTTIIGAYSKLDAMVHIGHGTVVGKRVLFPAAATISGNCVIGDDSWIGVNATVSNRLTLGEHSRVSLGSVVTRNVPAGQTVTGNFAIDHKRFIENLKQAAVSDKKASAPPPRTLQNKRTKPSALPTREVAA